jgi:hypothetical protein
MGRREAARQREAIKSAVGNLQAALALGEAWLVYEAARQAARVALNYRIGREVK